MFGPGHSLAVKGTVEQVTKNLSASARPNKAPWARLGCSGSRRPSTTPAVTLRDRRVERSGRHRDPPCPVSPLTASSVPRRSRAARSAVTSVGAPADVPVDGIAAIARTGHGRAKTYWCSTACYWHARRIRPPIKQRTCVTCSANHQCDQRPSDLCLLRLATLRVANRQVAISQRSLNQDLCWLTLLCRKASKPAGQGTMSFSLVS